MPLPLCSNGAPSIISLKPDGRVGVLMSFSCVYAKSPISLSLVNDACIRMPTTHWWSWIEQWAPTQPRLLHTAGVEVSFWSIANAGAFFGSLSWCAHSRMPRIVGKPEGRDYRDYKPAKADTRRTRAKWKLPCKDWNVISRLESECSGHPSVGQTSQPKCVHSQSWDTAVLPCGSLLRRYVSGVLAAWY